MNVPLHDGRGMKIYRELMHREARAAADWHLNYGPEALQKSPDPELMVNLGKFSKFASAPMPLNVQLRELQKEARVQSASMKRYEKATYPQLSDVPVSETSVKIFGEAAWHSQPKNGTGVPPSYEPPPPLDAKWTKRRWDVDHILHFQQELGAASVDARLKATGSSLAAEKPVGARRVWPN